jgi:bacteriorhodopsin
MSDVEQLSPRWRYAVIATFVLGFAVLILLTSRRTRTRHRFRLASLTRPAPLSSLAMMFAMGRRSS